MNALQNKAPGPKGGAKALYLLIAFFLLLLAFGILSAAVGAGRNSQDPGLTAPIQTRRYQANPAG